MFPLLSILKKLFLGCTCGNSFIPNSFVCELFKLGLQKQQQIRFRTIKVWFSCRSVNYGWCKCVFLLFYKTKINKSKHFVGTLYRSQYESCKKFCSCLVEQRLGKALGLYRFSLKKIQKQQQYGNKNDLILGLLGWPDCCCSCSKYLLQNNLLER